MSEMQQGVGVPAEGVASGAEETVGDSGRAYEIEPASESDIIWIELQARVPQMALESCTRGASGLLSVLAVLLPAHLALLALLHNVALQWAMLADALWLMSLMSALFVLLPVRWRFYMNCPSDIERAFVTMVKKKLWAARIGAALLVAGIILAVVLWPVAIR